MAILAFGRWFVQGGVGFDGYKYTSGMRIRLINMSGEPQMYCGLEGTVRIVDDMWQIHVKMG